MGQVLVLMDALLKRGQWRERCFYVFFHVQKMLLKADFRPDTPLDTPPVCPRWPDGKIWIPMARKSVLDSADLHVWLDV